MNLEQTYSLAGAVEQAIKESDAEKASQQLGELLKAAESQDAKVKSFVASSATRYFHSVPSVENKALETMMDLCEDANDMVRLTAIKGLGDIALNASSGSSVVHRVCDVFSQLLGTASVEEKVLLKRQWSFLFAKDTKTRATSWKTLITQASSSPETAPACFAIFQETKERHASEFDKDMELQRDVLDSLRGLLGKDISDDLFTTTVKLLQSLKLYRTSKKVAVEVQEALTKRAGLDTLDAVAEGSGQHFQSSLKLVGEHGVESFFRYFINKVLPVFESIPEDASRDAFFCAVVDYASYVPASVASESLPSIYRHVLNMVPITEPGSPDVDSAAIKWNVLECLFHLFNLWAEHNASFVHLNLGVFTPSGQPSESALLQKKEEFLTIMKQSKDACKVYGRQLQASSKEIESKLKEASSDEEKSAQQESLDTAKTATRAVFNVMRMTSGLCADKKPQFMHISPSWNPSLKHKLSSTQQDVSPAKRVKGSKPAEIYRAKNAPRQKIKGKAFDPNSSSSTQNKQKQQQTQKRGRGATAQGKSSGRGRGRGRTRGRGRGRGGGAQRSGKSGVFGYGK